jgi:hypothetical protein
VVSLKLLVLLPEPARLTLGGLFFEQGIVAQPAIGFPSNLKAKFYD